MKPDAEDWLAFSAIDEETGKELDWYVSVTFLTSNWRCLYGNGCPSFFGVQDTHITPDLGCCTKGAYFQDYEDHERVAASMELLTDEDWDDKLRSAAMQKGPFVTWPGQKENDDRPYAGKTRVVDGGCIFSNRADGSVGSTGKIGCAFGHLASRLGQEHFDHMPVVCSNLPLFYEYDKVNDNHVIRAWAREMWQGFNEEGNQDHWLHWWCMEAPEAFTAASPIYVTMKRELVRMMGQNAYDKMANLLDERWQNIRAEMPIPNGRPTIDVYVGNRKPKRPLP